MNRVRFAAAATLITTGLVTAVVAQTQPPPQLQPVLAGKRLTPPIKGEAQVEYTGASTKRDKDMVVTKVQVKNVSSAPIARLTLEESWYDKGGALVIGGKGVINGLLQPGEIQTITSETPYDSRMSGNRLVFTHVNGTVKATLVKKMDAPATPGKEPAAKPASAAKPPAEKK
jgi:hypothetical protein